MANLNVNSTQHSVVSMSAGTWAGTRDAAVGSGTATAWNDNYPQCGPTYYIARCFTIFDTSSIPAGATISAATFTFYSNGTKTANADATSYVVMPSTQDATISTADYNNVSFTNCGTRLFSALVNGANTITLNASGIAAIVKAGTTKFCLTTLLDQSNTPPTGNNYQDLRSSTAANLDITYTVPSGPANLKTWDGLATASVKTMDGLALASVKTWNGLT